MFTSVTPKMKAALSFETSEQTKHISQPKTLQIISWKTAAVKRNVILKFRYWFLQWSRWIQFAVSNSFSLTFLLILSSHQYLCLLRDICKPFNPKHERIFRGFKHICSSTEMSTVVGDTTVCCTRSMQLSFTIYYKFRPGHLRMKHAVKL